MDQSEQIQQVRLIPTVQQDQLLMKRWHVICFFQIIDDKIKDFLEFDKCNILADNYLIAMVFIYFLRASLKPTEYTAFNFFVALYLANIMEEDDDCNYDDIHLWAIANSNEPKEVNILKTRDNLFERMNYRCAVSQSCCELVMKAAQPEHSIWQRKRHVNHSGVISDYYRQKNTCPTCRKKKQDKMSKQESNSVPEVKRVKKKKKKRVTSNVSDKD